MNILSAAQQKIYEQNISDKERKKREKEFYDLYYKTREKDEHSFLGMLSLKTRQQLHKIIFLIFIIKNRISGFTYKVIKDERKKLTDQLFLQQHMSENTILKFPPSALKTIFICYPETMKIYRV